MEIFERVVCGVDRSEAGEAAALLASRLTSPEGLLTLVSVDDPSVAVHAGFQMSRVADQVLTDAAAALAEGRAAAEPAHVLETRLLHGDPVHDLLEEIDREEADLAVVGSHGLSRPVGIVLGSVATHVLHHAPCSVLVARPPRGGERWPRTIVAGVDGSEESRAALLVARTLAVRFGSRLRAVAAAGDPVDLDAARAAAPELEELPGRALHELHVLSDYSDLLVMGSRGLKGLRALGSVSERVAHEAACPVLVVRQPKEEP